MVFRVCTHVICEHCDYSDATYFTYGLNHKFCTLCNIQQQAINSWLDVRGPKIVLAAWASPQGRAVFDVTLTEEKHRFWEQTVVDFVISLNFN